SETENQEIEQALGRGADVFGKEFIHEDVNRGEEKGVTNAVQHLDQNDEDLGVGEEGEHGETHGVAEDAEDHGHFPAEFFQEDTQHRHGQDFENLAEAHDGHAPALFEAHPLRK